MWEPGVCRVCCSADDTRDTDFNPAAAEGSESCSRQVECKPKRRQPAQLAKAARRRKAQHAEPAEVTDFTLGGTRSRTADDMLQVPTRSDQKFPCDGRVGRCSWALRRLSWSFGVCPVGQDGERSAAGHELIIFVGCRTDSPPQGRPSLFSGVALVPRDTCIGVHCCHGCSIDTAAM